MDEKEKKNELFSKELDLHAKYITPFHREMGRLNGYPECCIDQFIKEQELNINSGIYRSTVHRKIFNIGYVPCDNCVKKL